MANSVHLFALRDGCRGADVPAALVAACALAAVSGPWVVHPDAYGTVCVVWPGDRPDVLAGQWDRTAAGRR